ncbi:hypothetical protein PAPYR_12592 [Paratrimastix pyriformis]|uniref:Uncharacterized protein n=1 Tax=Paratrimastix pyriformis TaxID=342808 RepID=A0ABQ8U6U4_9EUKA|nr:hypothetical protein PAPYR_12592 [Paratrimastix pyriformis]
MERYSRIYLRSAIPFCDMSTISGSHSGVLSQDPLQDPFLSQLEGAAKPKKPHKKGGKEPAGSAVKEPAGSAVKESGDSAVKEGSAQNPVPLDSDAEAGAGPAAGPAPSAAAPGQVLPPSALPSMRSSLPSEVPSLGAACDSLGSLSSGAAPGGAAVNPLLAAFLSSRAAASSMTTGTA